MQRNFLIIFIYISLWVCPCLAEFQPERLRSLLQQKAEELGHEGSIQLNPSWMRLSSGIDLLPLHELLVENPFDAISTASILSESYSRNPFLFNNHIVNASILLNQRTGFARNRPWPESAPAVEDSLQTLTALESLAQKELTPEQSALWRRELEDLPEPLYIFLHEYLLVLQRAWLWMQAGRAEFERVADLEVLKQLIFDPHGTPSDLHLLDRFHRSTAQKSIFYACAEMAEFLTRCQLEDFPWGTVTLKRDLILPTPMGDIVLSGTETHRHRWSPAPLLLLDLGGDDEYLDSFSLANEDQPFSITIDLAGEDTYTSESDSQGSISSVFGFSGLLDLGPESDKFIGKKYSLGYALAGVAILCDASGDTIYQAESHSLGTSHGGIAMLIDGGGNDSYTAYHASQGCGMHGGLGILLDTEGNDAYIAPATPVVFSSAQLPEQNYSASQGFGSGRFGPVLDGFNAPGGIGLLIDSAGDDQYTASVFAQGAGYGYGIGILVDDAGHDTYRASWYAMGSAAHSACGLLLDATGDDRYRVSHYMAGGAATDLSLGILSDGGGNDVYQALNASFGYGLDNSFALLADHSGKDSYTLINGLGFGVVKNDRAQTLRGLWPTYGFMIDLAGEDIYSPQRKNDSSWSTPTDRVESASQRLWGTGMDME